MTADELEPYDRVLAAFEPRSISTLKPGVAAFIGKRGVFEALWKIDEGAYVDEWAMKIPNEWDVPDAVWVPSGDLRAVES